MKFKSNSLVIRLWSIDQRVSFSAELLQWCWICRQMNMEFTLTHVLPYNVTNFSENLLRFIRKILNNVNETKYVCIFIFTNALYGEYSFKCLETTNSTCTVLCIVFVYAQWCFYHCTNIKKILICIFKINNHGTISWIVQFYS